MKQITPLAALVGFKTGVKRELGSKENNSTDDVLDISPRDESLLDKKASTRNEQDQSLLDQKTMNDTLEEQDELSLDRKAMLATHDQMRLEKDAMYDDVSSLDGSQSARDTVKKVFFNDLVKQHDDKEEISDNDITSNRRSNTSDSMNDFADSKSLNDKDDNSNNGDYKGKNDNQKFSDLKDKITNNGKMDEDDYKEKLEDDKLLKDYVPADSSGSGSGSLSEEDADKRSTFNAEEDTKSEEAAVPRDGGGGQEISGNSPLEDSVLHGPEAGISRVFIEPMIVKKKRKKRSKIMVLSRRWQYRQKRKTGFMADNKTENNIKRNRLRLLNKAVFSGEA